MTTPPETNAAPAESAQPEYDGPVSEVPDDGRFGENRTEDPYEPGRRASNAFRIGVTLLVLAIFAGAWWMGRHNRYEHNHPQAVPKAPTRVFFTSDQTDAMGTLLDPQAAAAAKLMAGWWSTHDTKPHDAAFTAWLKSAFPAPSGDRTAEMAQVKAAVATQDHGKSKYLLAARFLAKQGIGFNAPNSHGVASLWWQEASSLASLYDPETNAKIGLEAQLAVKLASQVAGKLTVQDQLSAPYVTDHSLAPDLTFVKKGACPCSYPAPHAAVAAAARTLLGGVQPPADPQYAWLQRQVAYSTLFLGHAYPSDLAAGTLLGDAVGEYVLVTRDGQQPATAP